MMTSCSSWAIQACLNSVLMECECREEFIFIIEQVDSLYRSMHVNFNNIIIFNNRTIKYMNCTKNTGINISVVIRLKDRIICFSQSALSIRYSNFFFVFYIYLTRKVPLTLNTYFSRESRPRGIKKGSNSYTYNLQSYNLFWM